MSNYDFATFRSSNGYRTRSLFFDVVESTGFSNKEKAVYWLEYKRDPESKHPVVKDHYIMSMDPTGYETAIKFFGSYEHWQFMYDKCDWFRSAVDGWKMEIATRMKSLAIKKIKDIAFSDEDKQSLAAAKYLATADYDKVDGRGRPSVAEVKGKLKEAIKIAEDDLEDMQRVGLRLVKK